MKKTKQFIHSLSHRKSRLFFFLCAFQFSCGVLHDGKPPNHSPQSKVIQSLSTNACKMKPPIGQIYFDCQMSDQNYELLREALQRLQTMHLIGPDAVQLQQLLRLSPSKSLSGQDLFSWLQDKIQFVLDETFESQPETTVASNFSSHLLAPSRYSDYQKVDVPGFGEVEVNSQKVGIILLGPGFFKLNPNVTQAESRSSDFKSYYAIRRLSNLIHEARHNQGRGVAFGFPHVICPAGNRNVGEFACDLCSNGAYAVQSLFLQAVLFPENFKGSLLEWVNLKNDLKNMQAAVLPHATDCDDALQIP